jgi:hypothetical protein
VNSTGAIELEVRVTVTTLPEPTAIALFGLGVPAVCLFLRRSGARCQGAKYPGSTRQKPPELLGGS